MKVIFIKFFPIVIFYTNKFIPKKFKAITIFNLIFIRPSEKRNIPLLCHEINHVRQQIRYGFIFHWILYRFWKKFRYNMELESYAIQLKVYKQRYGATDEYFNAMIYNFAKILKTKYDIYDLFPLSRILNDLYMKYKKISIDFCDSIFNQT